jgi:ubiquinone/menaquinone biosynthesis C-methylase UbiE
MDRINAEDRLNEVKTIENRWDILYRDYPEVYDRFAKVKKKPSIGEVLPKMFDFRDKMIVDVGSGTGLSTFNLAKYAKRVVGIEPEDSMRNLAVKNVEKKHIKNMEFRKGTAENMPLDDNSVDVAVAVTEASLYKRENIELFVGEAERILTDDGLTVSVDVAPGWYGGDLAPVILGRSRRQKGSDTEIVRNASFTALGFDHRDIYQTQDYGSLEKILSTYGFIFGRKAINHIISHKRTIIRWKFRIYYKYKYSRE